jgi:hypothetical protein
MFSPAYLRTFFLLAPSLVLWILSGLLIIQIDYYFLTTGLLAHLFVQLSILHVIYQQYSKLRATRFLSDLAAL